MDESTTVKVYNDKNFKCSGSIQAKGIIKCLSSSGADGTSSVAGISFTVNRDQNAVICGDLSEWIGFTMGIDRADFRFKLNMGAGMANGVFDSTPDLVVDDGNLTMRNDVTCVDVITKGWIYMANNTLILGKNTSGTNEECLIARGTINEMIIKYGTGGLYIKDNLDNHRVTINTSGYVGIGTSSPVCPLEITTSSQLTIAYYGYLSQNGQIGYINGAVNGCYVSLKAANRIWCGGEIDVSSDRRIKQDIDAIRSGLALGDLMRIVPVNYSHIDKPAHGGGRRTVGFIAQEVEAVWPDSVSKTTDFIPDIMAFGRVIERVNDTTIIVEFQSDDPNRVLDVGDKLRLIGDEKTHAGYVTLVDGKTFTIVVSETFSNSTSNIFVYGKEIDDFRVLNYDYIMTQNVAATQALYHKLVVAQEEIVELQERVSNQNVLNLSLQSRLSALEELVSKLL
jgi:hypothetical protein